MAGGQRPPANRMTLQTFKARRVGAKKGFQLLKKKRDALKSRFQAMLKEIVACKREVSVGMKEACFSLARAQYSGGDISHQVIERVKKPSVTLKLHAENVAGVYLPILGMHHDETRDAGVSNLGVAAGGQVIQACRQTHFKMVELLVKMASLQTSFVTLDEEIKMTSRRVNALDYVIIPQIDSIIAYITSEMDEEAREEFFRVKKVVQKKREKIEREKLQKDKEAAEEALVAPPSALDDKDPDVIF